MLNDKQRAARDTNRGVAAAAMNRKAKNVSDPGDTAPVTKTGVAKETSASVLGPMLPQAPLTGSTVQKTASISDEDRTALDALVEFCYYPDAVFDEKVRDNINTHATDVRDNSLPFQVRKMVIERAILRVKIAWCSKFKSKERKVKAYQKRYKELDSALLRINRAVTNDIDKKKMANAIKEIDKEVTEETKAKLNKKAITESVNALIDSMVAEGVLPKDMPHIDDQMLTESYPQKTFGMEDTFEESENLDLIKERKRYQKEYAAYMVKCKKAIKRGDYYVAAGYVEKCREILVDIREALKDYDTDSLTVNFIGIVLGYLGFVVKDTLLCFGVTMPLIGVVGVGLLMPDASAIAAGVSVTLMGLGGVAVVVATILLTFYSWYRVIAALDVNMKEAKKNGESISITILNGVYNKTLKVIDKMEKCLKDMSKALKEAKKVDDSEIQKELEEIKQMKESVELPINVFVELTNLYESGAIDLETYMDCYLEAKKPDDGMMEILDTLNRKGYKTKYSCSGHKRSFKEDRNDDGVINGKLTSGARIMFMDDYEFPDPPKHWGWKTVDGKDYLYVIAVSHNADKIDSGKAFDAWKNKYMASLKRWVDSLPDQKDADTIIKTKAKDEEDVTESAWKELEAELTVESEMDLLSRDLEDEIAMMLL